MTKTIEITTEEGGTWRTWVPKVFHLIHAVKFEDGTIWDSFNGWRFDEPKQDKNRIRWEYVSLDSQSLTRRLDEMGEMGYELICVSITGQYIFKRQK